MYKDSLRRLTSPYEDSPNSNIGRLFQVLDTELQLIKDTLEDMDKYCDIDQSSGYYLDKIGLNVQEARKGHSDSAYRGLIKSKILRNQSPGDLDFLITILSTILDTEPETIKIEEEYPAGIRVQSLPQNRIYEVGLTTDRVKEFLEYSVGAGVSVELGNLDFTSMPSHITVSSWKTSELKTTEKVQVSSQEGNELSIYGSIISSQEDSNELIISGTLIAPHEDSNQLNISGTIV